MVGDIAPLFVEYIIFVERKVVKLPVGISDVFTVFVTLYVALEVTFETVGAIAPCIIVDVIEDELCLVVVVLLGYAIVTDFLLVPVAAKVPAEVSFLEIFWLLTSDE